MDPASAVVPSATVIIKSAATGAEYQTSTSGFGYINTGSWAFGPRTGQMVAQFHW
jgi:hypothetical protein